MRYARSGLSALLGALLLGGCASPYQGGTRYPDSEIPVVETAPGTQPAGQAQRSEYNLASISQRPSAVSSLIERAQEQRRSGDREGALATLERALRISPRDGELYYELALTHQQLQQPTQARQLAQRGLSLAQDESTRRALRALLSEL